MNYLSISTGKNVYPNRVVSHQIVRKRIHKYTNSPYECKGEQPNILKKYTSKFGVQTPNHSKYTVTHIRCQNPAKTKCENHFCEREEIIYTCTNLPAKCIETTQIHSINQRQNLVPKLTTVQKFESLKYTHEKRQN